MNKQYEQEMQSFSGEAESITDMSILKMSYLTDKQIDQLKSQESVKGEDSGASRTSPALGKEGLIEIVQNFLVGAEKLTDFIPGKVDDRLVDAAKEFARDKGLYFDGNVLDKEFYDGCKEHGLDDGDCEIEASELDDKPPRNFTKIALKDSPEYTPLKYSIEDGRVKADFDWYRENIVRVEIPELEGITRNWHRIKIHKAIAWQFKAMFHQFKVEGVDKFLKTWHGSYYPRFIRGSTSRLSNHSHGTAFDINMAWNRLGHKPAPLGAEGTVRPLVEIANRYGFFWGGNYKRRKDGMHFEAKYVVEKS